MTNLPYIIEAQICFAILWLFYRIVLRRNNTFAQNRFYLLTMTLVSFILPLLSIPVYTAKVIVVQGGYSVFTMPEEIAEVVADDAQIGTSEILTYIYLAGLAIMLTILIFNGIKVWRIYKSSKIAARGKASVYHTDKIQSCFSFFNSIFLNPKDLNEGEIQQVMTHELAHVKLHHSRDLILGQALLIALWWNPFVWLWFRSIKEVHEFQADEAVLSDGGCNSEYYISLILKDIVDIHPEFVSGFSYSLIKNRLIMITSPHQKRFARFRILLSLPILLVLLMLFSFTERETVIEDEIPETTSAFTSDDANKAYEFTDVLISDVAVLSSSGQKPEENKKTTIQFTAPSKETKPAQASTTQVSAVKADKPASKDTIYMVHKDNPTFMATMICDPSSKNPYVANGVFTFIEKMPQFEGGEKALIQWLGSSVIYPKEAADKGIQGRVMVSFIVKKDGSISYVEIVDSPDKSLSNEAIRVIKSSPKWIPGEFGGKPVNVKFTMPVIFSLQ